MTNQTALNALKASLSFMTLTRDVGITEVLGVAWPDVSPRLIAVEYSHGWMLEVYAKRGYPTMIPVTWEAPAFERDHGESRESAEAELQRVMQLMGLVVL